MGKALRTASRLAAFASALACLPSHAFDVQWLGGTGSWADQDAWLYQVLPQEYNKVFIDAYGGVPGSVTYPYPDYKRSFLVELPPSVIAGLDIGPQGSLTLLSSLSVMGDVVSRGMLIGVKGNAIDGSLYVSGKLSLGGQGSTAFENLNTIRTIALTIESGHTLRGGGSYISSTIENRGLILATGNISIAPFQYGTTTPVFTNNGVIRVAEGGLFGSGMHKIENHAGRVEVAGGHFVGFVTGGTVLAQGGNSKLNGTLHDVTLQGQAQTTGLTLFGEVVNNGTLVLTPTENYGGYLYGNEGTVLSGNGEIKATGTKAAHLSSLTFGNRQTFNGSAVFTDGLTNRGTMRIEGAEGLVADNYKPNSLTNSGTIMVAGGSRLSLTSTNNEGGHIVLEAGSSIGSTLSDARLSGGTVTGHLDTSVGYLTFADLTLEGRWRATSGSNVGLVGAIVHNAELNVGMGSNSYAYLTLHGDTTFSGNGQTKLFSSTHWSSQIRNNGYYEEGNHTLTLGAGHVLTGTGIIGVTAVNHGLVLASSGDRLQFNRSWANDGTVRIQDGGAVSWATIDNRNGLIDIADGGKLNTSGYDGPTHGGVINGGGQRSTITGAFRDVTLTGTLSSAGGIVVSGNITNNGHLILGSQQAGGGAMTVDGQATILRGTGVTEIRDGGGYATLRGEFGAGALLTVAGDHRVIATGTVVDVTVRNQGRMDVAAGDLTLYRSTLENEGRLTVGQGSTLSSDSEITTRSRLATTIANGVIETPLLRIVDGAVLRGSGTVKGHARSEAGQITVDATMGGLRVTGNLDVEEGSMLFIHGLGHPSAGTAAQLEVGGNVTLGGILLLTFDSLARLGDTFDLLTSGGDLTGTFSDLQVLGTDLTVSLNYTSHGVSASLTSAVPEAGSVEQWAIGLALLGAVGMRRRWAAGIR